MRALSPDTQHPLWYCVPRLRALSPSLPIAPHRRLAFVMSKQKDMEAEIMSDVPNWEAQKSLYNSRWMPAMTVFGARRFPPTSAACLLAVCLVELNGRYVG